MIKNSRIVCTNADPDQYRRQDHPRGHIDYVMSSSDLRLFAQCPSRWVAGYNPPDSDAKDYGSLLDCLVLTPDDFKNRFAIKPLTYKDEKSGEQKPWNGNSNVCKAWLKDHEALQVVSSADVLEAQTALAALNADPVIKSFLECSDRQVWLAGEWHDEKTGLVIPIRGMLDLVPKTDSEFGKSLADLKSTRNAAVMPWTKWCYQAGYYLQSAIYADLYQFACPTEDRANFCFILSENYAPFQPAKRLLSHDFLELGRSTYKGLLASYCACLKAGQWPGYDDHDEAVQGWSLVSPTPWMEGESLFAPKFDFEEQSPAPEIEDYRH